MRAAHIIAAASLSCASGYQAQAAEEMYLFPNYDTEQTCKNLGLSTVAQVRTHADGCVDFQATARELAILTWASAEEPAKKTCLNIGEQAGGNYFVLGQCLTSQYVIAGYKVMLHASLGAK